ncbi:chorismate mutase [Actinomycetospora sp. NBRC 106378]|uniref:chorismate mutase n=1 Tax=Actinomycetospora sp. NBRC 106378 TaxID=3032208 RepID=UPI0024A5885E|nr:chorismate mutase [Actinomycetospora sp. NBRC 106378]GLZ52564.1 chorismate mutase [Actinomycetospora sp. NBRC 106378]
MTRRLVLLAVLALLACCAGCGTIASPDAAAGPWDPVVGVMADRLATADTVAASKYVSKAAVEDPARERVVLDAAAAAGASRRLDPAEVAAVLGDQIAASKVVQYGLLEDWTDRPTTAPTTPPDLAAVRTTLDAVTPRLVEALATAQAARTDPVCRGEVTSAAVRVAAARSLDTLHRRGLERAVRSLCA